ncbi:MAG: sortase family protein [uncultured bacterium]|nr:MAG: sortase family protein [uncultured bacterium]
MPYTKLKKSHLIRHHIGRIKNSEYFRILILRTIGNFLLFSSLFMIVKTFWQPVKEELIYFVNVKIQKKYVISDDLKNQGLSLQGQSLNKGLLAKAFNIKQVEILTPVDPNFSIVIPKIGANAKVQANIDASDEKIYLDALNRGVAHTQGTAFPGEGGHIFLFAHSTDYFWNVSSYNAIFYLLYKLEKNDEVNIFYQGQRYVYRVIGQEIVDPSQVQYLTRKTNREFLTLQTCWPPGTTLRRLLIFAVRVAE